MADGRRDDVIVVLEIVVVFLKLSERLADVAGDGRFLGDDESFAHVAAFLYAAHRRLRNLFFLRAKKFQPQMDTDEAGWGGISAAAFVTSSSSFWNSRRPVAGMIME